VSVSVSVSRVRVRVRVLDTVSESKCLCALVLAPPCSHLIQSSKYPTPYVPVPHPLWSPPPRLSRPLAGVCAPARAGARVLQTPPPL